MSSRGGYRHGRKRAEYTQLKQFHCYIKAENHAAIRAIGDQAGLTHGEIVDKLLEKHIERQKRRALVQVKDFDSVKATD